MDGINCFRIFASHVESFLLPNLRKVDEKILSEIGPKEARVCSIIIDAHSKSDRLFRCNQLLRDYVSNFGHLDGSEENFSKLNLLKKTLDYIELNNELELSLKFDLRKAIEIHRIGLFLENPEMVLKGSRLITCHRKNILKKTA